MPNRKQRRIEAKRERGELRRKKKTYQQQGWVESSRGIIDVSLEFARKNFNSEAIATVEDMLEKSQSKFSTIRLIRSQFVEALKQDG